MEYLIKTCSKDFMIFSFEQMTDISFSISDMNECTEKITINTGSGNITGTLSGCTQLCNNTDGSFNCYCKEGYRLFSDGKTCLGKSVS